MTDLRGIVLDPDVLAALRASAPYAETADTGPLRTLVVTATGLRSSYTST